MRGPIHVGADQIESFVLATSVSIIAVRVMAGTFSFGVILLNS
jgi:hypothetical protein